MENIQLNSKLIDSELKLLIDILLDKQVKIVDVIYDKVEAPEVQLELKDIQTTLIVIEKSKGEHVGIIYRPKSKENYKLVSLTMIGNALFSIHEDIRILKFMDREKALLELDTRMNDKRDNSRISGFISSMSIRRDLTDVSFGELMGNLIYDKGMPAFKLDKATVGISYDLRTYPIIVLESIAAYMFRYDLNAFLKYNNILMNSISMLAIEASNILKKQEAARFLYTSFISEKQRELITKLSKLRPEAMEHLLNTINLIQDGDKHSKVRTNP